MKKFLILISLLSLSTAGTAGAERILDTADGHTIVMESGQVVRLWGIEAPGIYHPFGKEAMEYLHSLLFDRDIELKDCRQKEDSESICKVLIQIPQPDGKFNYVDASEEVISKGLAYELSAVTSHTYSKAEKNARDTRMGIWGPSNNERTPELASFLESVMAQSDPSSQKHYVAKAHQYRLTLYTSENLVKVGKNTHTLEINTRAHDLLHTDSLSARATHISPSGEQIIIPVKVQMRPIMGEYELETEFPRSGKWQIEIQPTPSDEIISIELEVTNR